MPVDHGQIREPFDVGSHHGVLCGLGRDERESLELAFGRFASLFGELRFVDAPTQQLDFVRATFALAELFLYRLQLLAQVELFLISRQLALDLPLDLLTELEQVDLAVQNRVQLAEALADVERFEDELLLLQAARLRFAAIEIGDTAGVLDVDDDHLQLVR